MPRSIGPANHDDISGLAVLLCISKAETARCLPRSPKQKHVRNFPLKELEENTFSEAIDDFVNESECWRGLLADDQPLVEQLEKMQQEEQVLQLNQFHPDVIL